MSLRYGFRAAAAAAGFAASGLDLPHKRSFCDEGPKSTSSRKKTETMLQQVYNQRYGASKSNQLFFTDVHDLLKEVALPDEYIASRIFKVMDSDKSGSVSHTEMVSFCKQLGSGSRQDRVKFVFDACDLNLNGSIDAYELRKLLQHMIITCHNTVPNYAIVSNDYDAALFADLDPEMISHLLANRMVYDIFKVADTDKSGTINFKEFSFWFNRGDRSVKALNTLFHLFDKLVAE